MLGRVKDLIEDFNRDQIRARLTHAPVGIHHELLPAPHKQPGLRKGFAAVYVFSLSANAGGSSQAGAGRVLKVGRVGPHSDARFRSQHYGFSAGSTLAKSLVNHRVLWPWLGISKELNRENIKGWMLLNLNRDHFYVSADEKEIVPHLEMYVRARVGSVFEGSA